jgi:hypothetical protein
MVSAQMTRGAAISMALLAIVVLAQIVLLAWPTHSASDSPVGADAGRHGACQPSRARRLPPFRPAIELRALYCDQVSQDTTYLHSPVARAKVMIDGV